MDRIFFTLLVVASFVVCTVVAEPLLPAEFSGAVTRNGYPAPSGTRVSAVLNGAERGSIVTAADGIYGDPTGPFGIRLAVTGYEGEQGTVISFFIDGFQAQETAIFTQGTSSQLNLSATAIISNFTANKTSGTAPFAVQFTDMSTGSPSRWNWSFGDGAFSITRHPVHVYSDAGVYTVSLNATNAGGSNISTRTDYITVSQIIPAPIANFTANVTVGLSPRTIRFSDTSTGSPTGWNWSFGDSALSVVQHPVHMYVQPGNHTVTLTAFNAGGANLTVKNRYIIIYPKGDFNHNWKVDAGDAALVAYMVVNRAPSQVPDADFNANELVDIGDAAKIAYFVVGKIPEL
ncbi:MAG: PKD domain-containing protein [Methanoregula sp.]|jgi:PKD repeat protein|nr:PKD domain-containing protein [Methanoregula sp.]